MKKNTGKWCEFHKIPMHNTNECRAKESSVVKLKAYELDTCSGSEPKPNKGKLIIDTEPNTTITTTKVKKIEPEDLEES